MGSIRERIADPQEVGPGWHILDHLRLMTGHRAGPATKNTERYAMIWNGLIVTTNTPTKYMKPSSSYRGVAYGEAWPLQELPEPDRSSYESSLITRVDSLMQFRYEYGKEPPGVVNNVEFTYAYAECCRSRGISVRLLLCATTSPCPQLDDSIALDLSARAQFIGYDYIGAGWGYSALYDDLYSELPFADLEKCIPLLNTNGLFDKLSDLEHYIEVRWQILEQAGEQYVLHGTRMVRETPLEDWGSFWPCVVYELP
ncbi:MAG: hypothetical protein ABFD54_09800 [Armatimonadota bacterium]|nr:hypothetical protein [bacterium]